MAKREHTIEQKEQRQEQQRKYYAANREESLARNKKYRAKNPDKIREINRRYRKNHPEKVREFGLAHAHKVSGYPTPTRKRPEFCELCGGPPFKHALCLDHDHDTGKFRGWLCHKCNLGLGMLGDNEAGLETAMEYIRKAE